MTISMFYFQQLSSVASSAKVIDYDLIHGKASCSKLAEQWAILMRKLGDRSQKEDVGAIFRGIFSHMWPESMHYFTDEEHFSHQQLREKTIDLYSALSAVGRGDSESPLIARVMLVCEGVQCFCQEQLQLEPVALPPPTRPRVRQVSTFPSLTLVVNN